MNCHEAEILVSAYADSELDFLRRHAVERHLRDCADCRARHESVLALRKRFRNEVPYYAAPAALQARIRAMIGAVAATAPVAARPVQRWRWLSGGALAGCAATVLAWVLGIAVIDWRASDDLVAEAVSTHVRATLNDHLVQVASSDQHTVKPWLSARLDYSPPVHDMAEEGFPLVGGRLDNLDRHRVATLVYRYRLHTIDVFVRPESDRALPALRTVRGFNVAHATGSGMDWLAVSDVSADVLSSFVQRLAASQ
jgi:anti-sigma factor RsiW